MPKLEAIFRKVSYEGNTTELDYQTTEIDTQNFIKFLMN